MIKYCYLLRLIQCLWAAGLSFFHIHMWHIHLTIIYYLSDEYSDLNILPTCLSLPYLSFDILRDDIWMTLKFDLFGSRNDFEMTIKVKIFSGIHPSFFQSGLRLIDLTWVPAINIPHR